MASNQVWVKCYENSQDFKLSSRTEVNCLERKVITTLKLFSSRREFFIICATLAEGLKKMMAGLHWRQSHKIAYSMAL